MKKLTVLLLSMVALVGCSKPDETRSILQNQGYTDIQTQGWSMWKCSKDDKFATKFTAKSPNGSNVSGVVCGGFFKGSTIRLDN